MIDKRLNALVVESYQLDIYFSFSAGLSCERMPK